MDNLWGDLNHMELKIKKTWKYLSSDAQRIKEDSVSHIDFQLWSDNMEDYIYPIFKNYWEV